MASASSITNSCSKESGLGYDRLCSGPHILYHGMSYSTEHDGVGFWDGNEQHRLSCPTCTARVGSDKLLVVIIVHRAVIRWNTFMVPLESSFQPLLVVQYIARRADWLTD